MLAALMPPFAMLVPLIYGAEFSSVPRCCLPWLLVVPCLFSLGRCMRLSNRAFRGSACCGRTLPRWGEPRPDDSAYSRAGVWGAVIGNLAGTGARLILLMGGEVRALNLPLKVVLRDTAPLLIGVFVGWLVWWGAQGVVLQTLVLSILSGALGLCGFILGTYLTRSGLGARMRAQSLQCFRTKVKVPPARYYALSAIGGCEPV